MYIFINLTKVKCEKYWPDELREPKQYGDVVVNPISISQLDKYNISIFEVSMVSTFLTLNTLNFLNGIIHLPCFELSIIIC